jgi:NAD(P)-dependent dehydrogenase (short-subunit alcohol dehydrogenase family)
MVQSTSPVALVTGAGSGIGRAVALRLAAEGWSALLLGRRADALAATVAAAGDRAGALAVHACDISRPEAPAQATAVALEKFGRVDALVNAAGINTPRRSLEVLSLEDYHRLLGTNLHGAYHCIQAVLPAMRRQGSGTIVNINSEAGLRASAKSGGAYVASKFALAGLTQTINAEERGRGIRACSIFPGDVDTPLLEQRPTPPPAEARRKMMQPEDVAACVWLALSLPPRAVVEELLVRPQ